VVGRILRLSALKADDVVLEVGPGIGTLTEALLNTGATVIAIEKDPQLLRPLADIAAHCPERVTFIHGDALDLFSDATNPSHSAVLSVTALVANLPYAVAATVVLDCFQHLPSLASATVMVQKEVAQRMAAQPGSKDYGAYTVKLRLLARPSADFMVSKTSFLPPPRVDSTVIRLERRAEAERPDAACLNASFMLAEAAFAERRKTIRNSMRSSFASRGLDPATVDELLKTADIPPTIRGETLSYEQYHEMGAALLALT
jgi:16S rRNA (adenine1518-N6/adenine1519-N6)-dimethyltransferase